MISVSAVYGASAGVYAVALVALLAWLRRVPASRRRYCYPVVGVVGVAAATTALSAAGVGVVAVGGTELDLPSVVDDLVSYSVLWVVAALLADESRRTLAVFGAVPALQVLTFNVASIAGGIVGLVGLLAVVAGHGLLAYLLLGPVWDRAERLPDEQRLLHWKSRNLLLFLIGMLIVFALLSVAGVFDAFVSAVIGEYLGTLIRVGFAAFLFANVDAIAVDRTGSVGLLARSNDGESGVAGAD